MTENEKNGEKNSRYSKRGVKKAVTQYIEQRPAVNLYANDIAADLDLKPRQVQTAVSQIRATKVLNEIVAVGQGIYRYQPRASSNKEVYELVGVTKAGKLVIQDTEGRLYVAEEIS